MDIIKLDTGHISGTVIGEPGREVRVYRGIPYAAPPVGDLRWKPPQPVTPWRGIRECTVYSVQAAQLPDPHTPDADKIPSSEDCLYLNMLTPARNPTEKLPVMVWLHGGGFSSGHGNFKWCNGPRLPQNGVVLVTVNMRLATFGLMAHPLLSRESPLGVSGNYMYLDMIAALEWVQRNIAAFGGDSDNVTIFGQSGGGSKVSGLMASPLAKGLFHRAIIQSGGLPHGTPLKEQETIGEALFAKLGINRVKDPLALARSFNWKKIIEATQALDKEQGEKLSQKATGELLDTAVDGWFLADTVGNIFKAGRQNSVPFILGANLGELNRPFPIIRGKELVFAKMIPEYVDMFSGTIKVNAKGYAFLFNQVPGGWKQEGVLSRHAMELPFVFGALDDAEFWNALYVSFGANSPVPLVTDADRRASENMMKIWTRFARTGDPNVKGLITWPAWDKDTDRYLYIADPLEVRTGYSRIAPQEPDK
jgi:para-nitrobenzyl esterase